MDNGRPFIELTDSEVEGGLPPPPLAVEVLELGERAQLPHQFHKYGHLFPYGTTPSETWTDEWARKVIAAEQEKGYAICGAKKKAKDLVDGDDLNDPLSLVCKSVAGHNTDHMGEGRCSNHGGNLHLGTLRTGSRSLLRHNKISSRVEEYFDNDKAMDIRTAISTTWALIDASLEDEEEITRTVAADIGAMLTRVTNMIKQHNDIMEKRKLTIEVPEFMAWAEYFYELAVKHIAESGGDVGEFLKEAQQFYDATVTLVVGSTADKPRDSAGALDEVSSFEA